MCIVFVYMGVPVNHKFVVQHVLTGPNTGFCVIGRWPEIHLKYAQIKRKCAQINENVPKLNQNAPKLNTNAPKLRKVCLN